MDLLQIKMLKTKRQNGKKSYKSVLLIALCWAVYTCSYLGKLGYNANIAQIESAYDVSHSVAGMVSTFFFFAYGIGQVFSGIFCKNYNIRMVVFGSLLISGVMNLLVGFSDNFAFIQYFWLINGAALSVLWPSLIRLLSETLDTKDVGRAVVAMGTTVAIGTLFVYGFSALFVAFNVYQMMFYFASALLPLIAVVWLFSYPKLVTIKVIKGEEEGGKVRDESSKTPLMQGLWLAIVILAFFAIVDNLIKDGLTTWVPIILKEQYNLPDFISILLTMVLPILAILGTSVAVILHKKIKDFVMLCAVLFFVSALCIVAVILCMPTGWVAVTIGSFGIVSCLMAGVNNVITSMAPLYWKEKVNSGMLAGILNGFCYLGSTLSAYGLGLIADMGGWNLVFWLLFSLCAVAIVLSVFYLAFHLKKRKEGGY